MNRCEWVKNEPLEIAYHDREWGVPVHDDQKLFEFLILEGAQAGLSWSTILRKRDNYREAFDGFDPAQVARYDNQKKAQLLQNSGIVRNRLKIESLPSTLKDFWQFRKNSAALTLTSGNLSREKRFRINGHL